MSAETANSSIFRFVCEYLVLAHDRMILDLETSESSTRSIIENEVEGLIVTDQSGRITMSNDTLCIMSG